MFRVNNFVFKNCPCCSASVCGMPSFSELHGTVSFFAVGNGSVVLCEIFGLPSDNGIFAIHIHNGTGCTGNVSDPFSDSGSHLNTDNSKHPFHTGDFPPLFSNKGYAWNAFYTERFCPEQLIGLPIIIHSGADDFHTQPSGNSGEKIACGVIKQRIRKA